MTRKNYGEIAALIEHRAPTITMSELAACQRGSRGGRVVQLRAGRTRPGVSVAAIAGIAAVAAAVAGLLQFSGGLPPSHGGPGASRPAASHHLVNAKLTDAMVRKIARASHHALASAGHVVIRLTSVLGPYPDGSDLFDITFSHRNYNWVTQPKSRMPLIVRVVSGRLFFFGNPPPGRRLQWYLSTTQRSGGQSVPDPRTLLSALQPAAGFEDLGDQVIDGVQVEHLRATNLAGLSGKLRSLDMADQPLSRLDVWVDGSGVIRFMELHAKGVSEPTGLTERNTITIRFLDIGKPETILAPAHYGTEATHP